MLAQEIQVIGNKISNNNNIWRTNPSGEQVQQHKFFM